MTAVEFYPAVGASVRFDTGDAARYRLVSLDGIGPVDTTPQTIKSPGQVGETAVDVTVPTRVVTVQGIIQAADLADLWAARATLSASLPVRPVRPGEEQALGRLRILRDPLPPLEVLAMPLSSHLPAPRGSVGILPFDLEFVAPQPDWRTTDDAVLTFAVAGGFSLPLSLPLTMPTNNIKQDVLNLGDVDAPILARLYGACTDASITNATTGEVLKVLGAIAAGDYVEVSTAFEDKRVELVTAAGVRSSILSRLDLANAVFWSLRPGVNSVSFAASINTSGRAVLYWRTRYGGL
jgi:hypothetical protein